MRTLAGPSTWEALKTLWITGNHSSSTTSPLTGSVSDFPTQRTIRVACSPFLTRQPTPFQALSVPQKGLPKPRLIEEAQRIRTLTPR